MLVELRTKSQITIPKEVVERLGMKEGDRLELAETDGVIRLMPVTVYPKRLLDDLKREVEEVKDRIAEGTQPMFDGIDSLLYELER